jgi:hypothetical protein
MPRRAAAAATHYRDYRSCQFRKQPPRRTRCKRKPHRLCRRQAASRMRRRKHRRQSNRRTRQAWRSGRSRTQARGFRCPMRRTLARAAAITAIHNSMQQRGHRTRLAWPQKVIHHIPAESNRWGWALGVSSDLDCGPRRSEYYDCQQSTATTSLPHLSHAPFGAPSEVARRP